MCPKEILMANLNKTCSVCGESFSLRFSYQVEARRGSGTEAKEHSFFCSQDCQRKGHPQETIHCDNCQSNFSLEYASQIVFIDRHRHYACRPSCRKKLLKRPLTGQTDSSFSHLSLSQARVIAVFNHKGGTGKTTTSICLAAALAMKGKKTLLVDTDSQGNVGVSLALPSERSLYHVLVMGLAPEQAMTQARPNLDVLCSNETLAAAELYLAGRKQRHRVLAQRLKSCRDDYEYIIVDCSPSLSLLNQNALVFADAVLCPVACDYLSLVGVRQVLRTIRHVNKLLNHPVKLWGILPTLFDRRARICNEALETLRDNFKDRCLSPIRQAIRVKEAPAHGKTLFEYAPNSRATRDYRELAQRLMEDHEPYSKAHSSAPSEAALIATATQDRQTLSARISGGTP